MAVQDKSIPSFPLVFLQPVADVHYLWTALSLHVSPSDENGCDLFARLFNDFGLGEALNDLACILSVPNPQRFIGEFGAPPKDTNLILRIPVEYCVDAARHPLLERLRKMGYGLIADGLPPPNSLFSEHV